MVESVKMSSQALNPMIGSNHQALKFMTVSNQLKEAPRCKGHERGVLMSVLKSMPLCLLKQPARTACGVKTAGDLVSQLIKFQDRGRDAT